MVKCPICLSKSTFFSTINKYHYYICCVCQTLFLFPQPPKSEIDKYYKKNFLFQNGLIEESNIKKQSNKILKMLKRLNKKGSTLLDIGTGYGFFVGEAAKSGLITTGIEPSNKLYRFSKKLNRQTLMVNLIFDQFYKLNSNLRFDYITAIHVIEHLDNLKDFITKAFSLLNPNGILYIETPNLDSHLFYTEKQKYTFLTPPDHLWILSKKTFDRILPDNFGIIKYSTYSHSSHLMGIVKKNRKQNGHPLILKQLKYVIFDKLLAPLLTPFLNIGIKGSILELYIKKNS